MSFVHLKNARSDSQREVMEQIMDDGVCPFCRENLDKYHKNPIIKDGEYWIVTTNQWPYKGAKYHILAIAKKHIVNLSEIPDGAAEELFNLFKEVAREKNISGGTIAMRMGNEWYASSVQHLHAHFIEPDFDSPEHEGITFRVSKKK